VQQDRPYQEQAIEADISEYDNGVRRMMNVMATGTGKTWVFSRLYEKLKSRLPGQMLVVAHTEELVEQNRKSLLKANPGLSVGKEMAGEYADESNDDIISASVQTLGRKGSSRAARFNWERVDKVVIDEAHHSVTDAYGRILELAGSLRPDTHKILVGTTATIQRPDGKALSDIYEKVAFVYSLRQAIADGWLVPVRGFRIQTDTVLDSVESSGGDFTLSQLSKAVDNPARNRTIVRRWKELAGDRRTIAFTTDIDHAKHLCESFCDAGVKAEYIYGEDPEREDKLRRHQNGTTQVLCNCAVLVEGYDDPAIGCVLLARPTQSGILFCQMVGRGTRISPGKLDCIVLDVVDSTIGNSLVTLPTLMGLSNILDLKGRRLDEVVTELELVQLEHPSIDLTTLKDIDELQTIVSTINLFEVRFPAEVEANSDLIWFKACDGGYRINVPKDGPERAGFLRIQQNPLGQWAIEGRIKDAELAGVRSTMEEAFKVGDEQIRKRLGQMRLSYLLREATWHNKPVTTGQRKMLERLFPHRKFPWPQMTSGMASKMIAERLDKK
jgi:ATP-dependent helicase IRC3